MAGRSVHRGTTWVVGLLGLNSYRVISARVLYDIYAPLAPVPTSLDLYRVLKKETEIKMPIPWKRLNILKKGNHPIFRHRIFFPLTTRN